MLFTFACPKCASRLEAEAQLSGSFAECPHCQASVHVPPARIGPGTTIGGFRLERLLGRGGMGEVYLATQLSMDRQVAVKILAPSLTTDRAFVARFLTEVRTTAKLEHPNIVTAFDAGEDAGTYYLAMAYVEGESLDERLRREGPLPEQDVLHLGLKLSKALGYAWEHFGVLHRDIKPSNIMLDRFGEVKLMDLGVAKTVGEDTGLTLTGVALGTPSYMSPEQARGASDLDCRSDIYSLGCCMFHLLTGHAPFAGRNALEVLNQHVTAPVPGIRAERPDVSASCEALIQNAMQKDRRRRPRSWAVLAAQIEAVLAGEALPELRPRPPPRTWVTIGATVLVVLLLAEMLVLWLLSSPARARGLIPWMPAAPGALQASAGSPGGAGSAVQPASSPAAAVNRVMDRIADLILERRLAEARELWRSESARLAQIVSPSVLEPIDSVVASVTRVPERVMESFRADVGRATRVTLREGVQARPRTLFIEAVREGLLEARDPAGAPDEKIVVRFQDLALDEQLRRLGPEEAPNPDLCRGLVYLYSGQRALAAASFRRAAHPLGDALLLAMDRWRAALAEAQPRPVRRLRDWFAPRPPSRPPAPAEGSGPGM